MVKRTTISIPDALHRKMEIYKGDFNFSKEFQNHISELIERKEEYEQRLKGDEAEITEIIERLKAEKNGSIRDWIDRGQDDGLAWAKIAHYEELQYVLNNDFAIEPDSFPSPAENGFTFWDTVMKRFGADDLIRRNQDNDCDDWLTTAGSAYIKGFTKAVNDFWNQIKDRI